MSLHRASLMRVMKKRLQLVPLRLQRDVFCLTMLSDAAISSEADGPVIKDIAEIVAEHLPTDPAIS